MTTQQTRPARARRARTGVVVSVSRVTPRMIRVVLGGEGLAGFAPDEFTDAYVKLLFPPPGAGYRNPFDVEQVQRERPRDEWPLTRTYTVRAWDAMSGQLTLEFVHHGDSGIAGPWAASARPGDAISLYGPGGGYAPDPAADWHLFVGDESALPAIATALARVPAGVQARVFVEVQDAGEHQDFDTRADLDVVWLHRSESGHQHASRLVDTVRATDFPVGTPHAFVHGDAGFVREVRRYLRVERGVPREALSASGYWRRGRTDEAWRGEKAAWSQDVEADEAQLSSSPRY